MTSNTVPHFNNMILQCKDCGNDFLLTTGEQQFYFENELSNPVRCPACRLRRKLERGEDNGHK